MKKIFKKKKDKDDNKMNARLQMIDSYYYDDYDDSDYYDVQEVMDWKKLFRSIRAGGYH